MRVTADGNEVCTTESTGILSPGWHGSSPETPTFGSCSVASDQVAAMRAANDLTIPLSELDEFERGRARQELEFPLRLKRLKRDCTFQVVTPSAVAGTRGALEPRVPSHEPQQAGAQASRPSFADWLRASMRLGASWLGRSSARRASIAGAFGFSASTPTPLGRLFAPTKMGMAAALQTPPGDDDVLRPITPGSPWRLRYAGIELRGRLDSNSQLRSLLPTGVQVEVEVLENQEHGHWYGDDHLERPRPHHPDSVDGLARGGRRPRRGRRWPARRRGSNRRHAVHRRRLGRRRGHQSPGTAARHESDGRPDGADGHHRDGGDARRGARRRRAQRYRRRRRRSGWRVGAERDHRRQPRRRGAGRHTRHSPSGGLRRHAGGRR